MRQIREYDLASPVKQFSCVRYARVVTSEICNIMKFCGEGSGSTYARADEGEFLEIAVSRNRDTMKEISILSHREVASVGPIIHETMNHLFHDSSVSGPAARAVGGNSSARCLLAMPSSRV